MGVLENVGFHVRLQIVRLGELLLANVALMWFILGMGLQVLAEFIKVDINLVTH